MAETKNETVILYFEDNVTRADAVKLAVELGLDPSAVKKHPLGDLSVYGIEIECEPGFKTSYLTEYVNPRSNEGRDAKRGTRCDIPSKRNHLRKCPESRSCKGCPYRDYKPTSISIEQSADNYGYDIIGAIDGMSIQERIELKDAIAEAIKKKPREVAAFLLENEGYSKKEIQARFGISSATVYRWIDDAAELLRSIWLEE